MIKRVISKKLIAELERRAQAKWGRLGFRLVFPPEAIWLFFQEYGTGMQRVDKSGHRVGKPKISITRKDGTVLQGYIITPKHKRWLMWKEPGSDKLEMREWVVHPGIRPHPWLKSCWKAVVRLWRTEIKKAMHEFKGQPDALRAYAQQYVLPTIKFMMKNSVAEQLPALDQDEFGKLRGEPPTSFFERVVQIELHEYD